MPHATYQQPVIVEAANTLTQGTTLLSPPISSTTEFGTISYLDCQTTHGKCSCQKPNLHEPLLFACPPCELALTLDKP